jgi:flagellar M-ring protein FliF
MAKVSTFDPGAILAQLFDSYIKLPIAQKILFPLLVVGCVMGIIIVSRWANQPDYSVLFSDLEAADASAVVERLKALKIKYQVIGDGRTISISPPDLVHELRLELASEGIPHKGSVGYEVFDGMSVGMTQSQEMAFMLRAKQGELERTIGALDAIDSVRVHITDAERGVFANKDKGASASVLIRLRAGGELTRKQVQGIANLVAGSVAGLSSDNVTIIDHFGNLLTQSEEDRENNLGGDTTRVEYQRAVERSFIERVEQMLQKILGPGRAIARVTAELDFSSSERHEESYDASGQVLRSERSVSESASSSQRGGVPGVVSNLTNDPKLLSPPQDKPDSGGRNENVKNYEVSKALVKSVSPRGTLTRLSVAVLVDGTYEEVPVVEAPKDASKEEGKEASKETMAPAKRIFKSLEPELLTRIEGLVRSAVGFDPARGDVVTVESIPFFEPDAKINAELDTAKWWRIVEMFVSSGFPYFFALLFLYFVVWPLAKFLITPSAAEVDLRRLLPTGVAELEKELEQERTKATIPVYEPTVDLEQLEELMAENSRIVKDNPQQAALLIRWWLNDARL